ncbi:MAG: hypothetical protein JWN67_5012 [Actinomycetia bacterium]|nr:hypothetical protein [Actinomycetes bacterium]
MPELRTPEGLASRRDRWAARERCRRAIAAAHPETFRPALDKAMEEAGWPLTQSSAYRRAHATATRATVEAHREEFETLMANPPEPQERPARATRTAPDGVYVRVGEEALVRLRAEAERRDVTVAWLVRRAVERKLPEWEAQAL